MPPEFSRRMKQFLILRLLIVVIGFILVTFYVTYLRPESPEATTAYLFSILALYALVGVASLLTFERWRQNRTLLRLQVVVDFALQALLVWSTGGVVSVFTPLLFVTFVSSTTLASTRGALWLATMTTLFLVGNTFLYALDVTPPSGVHPGTIDSRTTAYLVMSILALYSLSILGSRYSSGLEEAEHLQEEVIDNMAEGLIVIDRDARVMLLNEELRRALRLEGPAFAYRGKLLVEVLKASPEFCHDKDVYATLLDALLQGERGRFEIAPVDRTGKARPFEVKVTTIRTRVGADEPSYRVALFSDLTLQREVEAKERRIQQLEDLHQLAMGLAHEIRNPLASIRGCVQELGRLAGPLEGQRRLSEIIVRESDRLDGIVENFLRFARPTAAAPCAVDVHSLVSEAVVLLRNRHETAARVISWTPSAEAMTIRADRGQLVQVLLNLGINAIQATSPSSGRIGFEVRRSGEQAVEIQVWDNGKGIPAADQRKVFQPFFTTKEGGSGLGLSIVEKIIQEHGGTVEVESAEGAGTRFVLLLPAAAAVVADSTGSRDHFPAAACRA